MGRLRDFFVQGDSGRKEKDLQEEDRHPATRLTADKQSTDRQSAERLATEREKVRKQQERSRKQQIEREQTRKEEQVKESVKSHEKAENREQQVAENREEQIIETRAAYYARLEKEREEELRKTDLSMENREKEMGRESPDQIDKEVEKMLAREYEDREDGLIDDMAERPEQQIADGKEQQIAGSREQQNIDSRTADSRTANKDDRDSQSKSSIYNEMAPNDVLRLGVQANSMALVTMAVNDLGAVPESIYDKRDLERMFTNSPEMARFLRSTFSPELSDIEVNPGEVGYWTSGISKDEQEAILDRANGTVESQGQQAVESHSDERKPYYTTKRVDDREEEMEYYPGCDY